MQIVGVSLLRNEEYFAAWALMNAAAFCDRIIVMDNCSQDRTRGIVEAVAREHSHIEIIDVRNVHRTHKYLEPLVGTPTWVFCIDGDEIYDPAGLAKMRKRLMAGDFDRYSRVGGKFAHIFSVFSEEKRALGYFDTRSVTMNKLFNFLVIKSWSGGTERLHGGRIIYKPEYDGITLDLWKQETWNETEFRCLHLCFLPRSSLDASEDFSGRFGRKNPAEFYKTRFLYQRLRRALRRRLKPSGVTDIRDYKRNYAQGPVGEFGIAGFNLPSDFRALDPYCDEAMAVLHASSERQGVGPAASIQGGRA